MQRNQVWPTFVIFQTLRRRDTQKRQSFKWQVECSENNVWKVAHVLYFWKAEDARISNMTFFTKC